MNSYVIIFKGKLHQPVISSSQAESTALNIKGNHLFNSRIQVFENGVKFFVEKINLKDLAINRK